VEATAEFGLIRWLSQE